MPGVGPSTGIETKLYFTTADAPDFQSGKTVLEFVDFVGSSLLIDPTSDSTLEANLVDGVASSGAMEQSANTISVGVLGEASQRTYPGQSTPAEFTFEVIINYEDTVHIALEALDIGDDGILMFYSVDDSKATLDWAKVQLAGKSKQVASDDVARVSYTWTLPHGPFITLNKA